MALVHVTLQQPPPLLQYAVLTTALTTPLHEILHHMRWMNVMGEEHEHGFAG